MGHHPNPIVLAIAFLALLYSAHAQLGASYGEGCGASILCDPRSLLSCINGSCSCIKPKEMAFSKELKKCLVLSGGKCVYSQDEKLDCIKNAECQTNGYCQCVSSDDNEYYEGPDHLCVLKGAPGENCTMDGECREDMLLTCHEGICSCDPSTSVFEKSEERCSFLAGSPCDYSKQQCVANSACTPGYPAIGVEDHRHACACRSGYRRSTGNLCLSAHDQICDGDEPCHQDFACINGNCQCHFPTFQEYDYPTGQCVSKLGGPCLEKVDGKLHSFPCAENTECSNSTGVYECSCTEGWIQTSATECKPAHGQPCLNSLIGPGKRKETESKYDDCDPAGKLVCRDEKCSCPHLQFYNEGELKCRGLVGAQCPVSEGAFCTSGAYCKPFRDPGSSEGICRCGDRYEATDDRKCAGNGDSITGRPGESMED